MEETSSIYARGLGGAPVAVDDATLTVRSGAAADAAVVTGGEHTEVYIHVQSSTLAGLDGTAELRFASVDPVNIDQNLYSSDNTENGSVNWAGLSDSVTVRHLIRVRAMRSTVRYSR